MHRVAVLGGGISGLVAAHQLSLAGQDVELFEATDRVGGVIRSELADGFLLEHGPNSIQPGPEVWKMIESLGLLPEMVEANSAHRNRFVVRDAMLHPVPLSPGQFFRASLFSPRAKVRLLREPLVGKASQPESVAEFVRRRLGNEFLQYAIDPFVAGVYAGDPEQLSMQHAFPRMVALEENYGSLIIGMLAARKSNAERPAPKKLISFGHGMETIPRRLASRLGRRIYLQRKVRGLEPTPNGLSVLIEGSDEKRAYDCVLSCIPVHAFRTLISGEALSLPDVTYPPVTVVGLGYERSQVRHPMDGFGLLVPSAERDFRILGALFSSTLFPGRAPDGSVLITVFLGGMRHANADYLEGDSAVQVAHNDVARLLSIAGRPTFSRIVEWKRAIPQYDLEYDRTLCALDSAERAIPGLFFAGNYRGGISVVDSITSSAGTAQRILEFLHSDARQ